MLITIDTNNITERDSALLRLVLEGYDGTNNLEAKAEPEKPVRKRRTKAEMEAARQAETEITVENSDGVQQIQKTEAEIVAEVKDAGKPEDNAEVTIEEIKAGATKLLAEKGREAVQEIVTELGLKRISDAPEDRYSEVMAAIQGKLSA